MHLRFSPKIRLLGRPPNPPARAALLPCQTLHRWGGYAPLRALNTGDLTGWKEVCSQRPAGRADAPLGAMKKTAVGGSFMGFGVGFPTSVLQECVRSCPACHDCFRWYWDSRHA